MNLAPDACYRALSARDLRFDGVFFVGVKTTGIYCRPICPARTPAQARCEFFTRAAEAERAGFRACFRCRPELAPGLSSADSIPRLVQRAAAHIESGYLNEHGLEDLARSLKVSSRHLRRAVKSELGVSPLELAQTRRLALAKQLLQDTTLPSADVAFAAGFSSIRRFNALIQKRLGRPPLALRRGHGTGEPADFIRVRLDYRPPLDWPALTGFLAARAIPGVEQVSGEVYRRTVQLGAVQGWLAVQPAAKASALEAQLSLSLAPKLMETVARIRALLDLDAQPHLIEKHLRKDARLRPCVSAHPGLRVPGAFDGFETSVRGILGQQVSVRGATTLSGRLVRHLGTPLSGGPEGLAWLFPSPARLAEASVAKLRALGLPEKRAQALIAFARAVAEGLLDISPGAEPHPFLAEVQRIPGIGPWTAHDLAMRVLRWPNAFPSGDWAICKALGVRSALAAEKQAAAWQPWRAYAALHLWHSLSSKG